MSFFDRLFGRPDANEAVRPLYDALVAEGRAPHWYRDGGVPDTIDGRFEMIAAILALVITRLELESEQRQNIAWLIELFVADMDGQLREIGIGDMVVGKHVGRMMGALGGRLAAFREAGDREALAAAVERNIFRGAAPSPETLDIVSARLDTFRAGLAAMPLEQILEGRLPAHG